MTFEWRCDAFSSLPPPLERVSRWFLMDEDSLMAEPVMVSCLLCSTIQLINHGSSSNWWSDSNSITLLYTGSVEWCSTFLHRRVIVSHSFYYPWKTIGTSIEWLYYAKYTIYGKLSLQDNSQLQFRGRFNGGVECELNRFHYCKSSVQPI